MVNAAHIRKSQIADVPSLVTLSYQKRRNYEKAQPEFWKYAGPSAEESQKEWFADLLNRDDYIMLTAMKNDKIVGFIIGQIVKAPEVYDPGGLTLMIDDFCVDNEDWLLIGSQLIGTIKQSALNKDVKQVVIVCGAHDEAKRKFLKEKRMNIASEWYVGNIDD